MGETRNHPELSRVTEPASQVAFEKLNCVGLGKLGLKHCLQTSFVVSTPFSNGIRDVLEQCRSRSL